MAASVWGSGVDLDRLRFRVEFSRRGALFTTAGAGTLHAAEGGVRIDAGRVSVYANEPRFDAMHVSKRRGDVACKERCAQSVRCLIRDVDGLLEVIGGEHSQDRAEEL